MKRMKRTDTIEADGKVKTLEAWAESIGVEVQTIKKRIKRGMSPSEAVTKPKVSASDAGRKGCAMAKRNGYTNSIKQY